uniref:Uncharacterized protein n=1 Tax=viral metagenome TaxID=1070528 RepID=A0A6M3J7C8_9ZZZZ
MYIQGGSLYLNGGHFNLIDCSFKRNRIIRGNSNNDSWYYRGAVSCMDIQHRRGGYNLFDEWHTDEMHRRTG